MSQLATDAAHNGNAPAAPYGQFRGLSKREAIAGQIMASLVSTNDVGQPEDQLAKMAVSATDALLIELEKLTEAL